MKTSIMTQFIDKFRNIEAKVSKKFGEFILFGLFLPEDAPNKWDLVVSAIWLKRDNMNALKSISEFINNELGNDIIKLSKVVVVEPTDAFVKSINSIIQTKNTCVEFANCDFNGLQIKQAYIITSQKTQKTGNTAKPQSKADEVYA